MSKSDQSDPSEPDLPEALRRDLREVFGPRVQTTRRVDDAVRAAARLRFRRGRRWIPKVAAAAAAAALVLALSVHFAVSSGAPPAARSRVARSDFDGNGRLDILDAYRMALRIARAQPVGDRWDQDGDGRIDATDVDLLARRAVAIGGPR